MIEHGIDVEILVRQE